jgi:hypothetical protein
LQDAKAPKHAKAQFQNLSLNKIHDLRFLQFLLTLYVANQAVCSVGDQEHQGYEEAAAATVAPFFQASFKDSCQGFRTTRLSEFLCSISFSTTYTWAKRQKPAKN